MKFFKDVFKLLKDTTWPTRKERWTDFISVMEYTAFFVVIIYIFDKVVASSLPDSEYFLLITEVEIKKATTGISFKVPPIVSRWDF